MSKIEWSFEKAQKAIEQYGYELIEYSDLKHKNIIKDQDGYYYNCPLSSIIYKHKIPRKFNTSNPYTIQNIKRYIELNNIKSTLLSESYINNSTPLDFMCDCGRHFKKAWSNYLQGSNQCSYCRKSIVHKNMKKIQNALDKMGLKLLGELTGKQSNDYVDLIDNDGYKYHIKVFEIYRVRETGNYDNHQRFSPNNPFTIDNINNFLVTNNIDYTCISSEYKSNTDRLSFVHCSCGTILQLSWNGMLAACRRYPKGILFDRCPCCKNKKTESYHALILKQIFLHEYPDTSTEDNSCINPNTNRNLPTDIVNHRLKLAIEIQSDYHDREEQAERDKIKENYWIKRGYTFYNPDIRDYSIIQMIRLFFPNINKIPDYVDFNFANVINRSEIQRCLDLGYSIKNISQMTNINDGTIRSGVTKGKLTLPDDYKLKVLNWKPIVQLNDLGEYVKTYQTVADADRAGYKRGTVQRVLRGDQKMAYKSYWIYESDYISGNYSLNDLLNRFIAPVDKYDINGNFVKSYPNIYRAEADSNSNKSEILRIINDPTRTISRGEIWKKQQLVK